MLGIRQVILAINKMDLVGWTEERYATIMEQYALFARELGFDSVAGVPLSALNGDNVVRGRRRNRSTTASRCCSNSRRLAPGQRERGAVPLSGAMGEPAERVVPGYAGLVSAGSVSIGDRVRVEPSAPRPNRSHRHV